MPIYAFRLKAESLPIKNSYKVTYCVALLKLVEFCERLVSDEKLPSNTPVDGRFEVNRYIPTWPRVRLSHGHVDHVSNFVSKVDSHARKIGTVYLNEPRLMKLENVKSGYPIDPCS